MKRQALCRDCLSAIPDKNRCPKCGSPRVIAHDELFSLNIAHMDCDAFYASVEKRDNPELRDKPVIIGGGTRGVVSTACYIARIKGVHSAMPMFKALKVCPEAVVVRPRMDAYVAASKEIREMMDALTPVVEPLSLDEAFMDLSGTEHLHGEPPALSMARLIKRMETELQLSGSIGLSHNKFLAKLASDLDKPRGFSIIGVAETESLLAPLPIKKIWGVGKVTQSHLERDGIRTISDLRRYERKDLANRYGTLGDHLWHLCRGIDNRHVSQRAKVKSISKETTFDEDTASIDILDGHLWRLAEQVSMRAKAKGQSGHVVTIKVKQSNFQSVTRRITLREPTQMAERIYKHARRMLDDVIPLGPFRLIGVGISNLDSEEFADQFNDLLEQDDKALAAKERATDAIRKKFGNDAIVKGRSLR
ncbi:DNA polymerase IV [Paramylibacter ulvae]|uniref:DNA polymerase IV n=1 Tax=Paramylibacter ulvae TaxID=1651968 RepID=UPI0016729C3A|nr:DNA polymerase IV [Amylibacter ulvae]